MAHISSLDSNIMSFLDIYSGDISGLPDTPTPTEMAALFVGATPDTDLFRMPSVREFPAFGNAANITNVPVYGQKQSSQVSGQADAPTMDITVNYVAADMLAIEALLKTPAAFRFMMAAENVTPAEGAAATLAVENTEYYFVGKIEAIQVTPSLSDAGTAVVNLSVQGDFVGPSTIPAS